MCYLIVRIFALLYLLAVVILIIGTFGLMGQDQDPLSGVFLLPLGLPWALWLDGLSEPLKTWAGALAPLPNLLLLGVLCRLLGSRRA